MTHADHQRLTPWLLLVVALQLAVLIAQAMGVGRQVHWLPALPPGQKTGAQAEPLPPTLPLEAYANSWERPLFSPRRQPDTRLTGAGTTGSLQGWKLTGSIITDTLRVALLKDADGKTLSLVQGKALPGGWTLQRLEGGEATFVLNDQQQRLRLRPEAAPPPEHP